VDNPCSRLEAVKVTRKPPAVFSSEQFKAAVKWLKENAPEGLPWFALSTLCGLRPEEAEKTTKADINFKEGFVKVEAQTTKVRQRRIVYPKAEALRFLKRVLKHGGLPLSSQNRRRIIAGVVWKSKDGKKRRPGLRHALGFDKWPKDITRHTAASYWLASGATAGHVAEMLGNSERILKRDYKALVTRKEAVEFWEAVSLTSKT
jgi:integrase